MKLGVVCGTRFRRVGSQYYTATSYHSDMWKECLAAFEEVVILDRAYEADEIEPGDKPAVVEGVRFIEYPNSYGFFALLKIIPKMFCVARKAARQTDVWHLHGPCIESFLMWFWVWFYNIPYSQELRGDQGMSVVYLKLRGVKFARLIAFLEKLMLRFQLSKPILLVGVSQSLVRDFPPRNNCPTYNISDSRIPEQVYGRQREWYDDSACRTIVCLGRLEAQKHPLGTMRVLAKLIKKGYANWKFVWIGGGPLQEETQKLADELDLTDKVNLMGFVPWDNVFGILDTTDLFLLNSVSEGLPRALLEAMARGLPAIGTDVGGVSELLSPEDVVPMLQEDILADKLYEVLTNSIRLTAMSQRNIKTAKRYSAEVLSAQKIDFYKRLRRQVETLK